VVNENKMNRRDTEIKRENILTFSVSLRLCGEKNVDKNTI